MFYYDNKQHNLPHIHIEFAELKAVLSLHDGTLLSGDFPKGKLKLVLAWVEIHKDELMADWKLAIEDQHFLSTGSFMYSCGVSLFSAFNF